VRDRPAAPELPEGIDWSHRRYANLQLTLSSNLNGFLAAGHLVE